MISVNSVAVVESKTCMIEVADSARDDIEHAFIKTPSGPGTAASVVN